MSKKFKAALMLSIGMGISAAAVAGPYSCNQLQFKCEVQGIQFYCNQYWSQCLA